MGSSMISQTIEYALRAMVYLASLGDGGTANSESVAKATKVPKGYLSKVMRDLVLAGLIGSQRGPNGGFCLQRLPKDISILDEVNAVDPIGRIKRCPLGNPEHMQLCPLHKQLDGALDTVEQGFARTSLAEIIESAKRARSTCPMRVQPTIQGR